jgi:hypothetical protein
MGLFSKSPGDGSGGGGNPPGKPDSPSKGAGPKDAAKPGARPAQQQPPATSAAKPPPVPGSAAKAAAVHPPKPQADEPPAVIVTRTIEISGSPSSRSPVPQAKPAAPPANATPAQPASGTGRAAGRDGSATAPGRPAAPDVMLAAGKPPQEQQDQPNASIAETFERLLSADEVDQSFASVEVDFWTPSGPPPGAAQTASDWDEVRSLFAHLAANHVRQVRDLMLDLRLGDATVDWIGICQPALRSLRRAADKLELKDLCAALDGFSEALAASSNNGSRSIAGDSRTSLLTWYDELVALMPQAFALDLDRSQREAVILQSLLLQVPGVKKVTLDKLYAAGLSTLEALLLATPADVAATTGISEALATGIVARFREYRDQVRAAVPDATRAHERERIAQLTTRLRHEHYEYELAAQGWTPEADEKKRALRAARAQTLLDIQVVLARLGEVDRLKEIERLPFERKLAHLESFLEEARDKYAAQT